MCHYSRFASTSRTVLDFKKIFKLVVNPFIKIESVPLSSLFTEPSNRTSWKWDCGWPQSSFVNFVCSLNMPIKCFSGIVVFSYFLALFGRKQAVKKTQILPLNFLFSFSIKFLYDWTIDSFVPSKSIHIPPVHFQMVCFFCTSLLNHTPFHSTLQQVSFINYFLGTNFGNIFIHIPILCFLL